MTAAQWAALAFPCPTSPQREHRNSSPASGSRTTTSMSGRTFSLGLRADVRLEKDFGWRCVEAPEKQNQLGKRISGSIGERRHSPRHERFMAPILDEG